MMPTSEKTIALAEFLQQPETWPAQLRYTGQCTNDGATLQPAHLVYILNHIAGDAIALAHAHREALTLAPLP